MIVKKHLKYTPVIDYSGYKPRRSKLWTIKKKHYFIEDKYTITGDAPKNFVRAYEYKKGKRRILNTKDWDLYIAKLGHKWYPVESITEMLLNRIGEVLGFNMSVSRLAFIGNQFRFLSLYFLSHPNDQELIHGADLYAGYLNDKAFVEQVEKEALSQDFFTIQFSFMTIKHFFPAEADVIVDQFIKMLLYDAIIGNNDRHFYNWGIVRSLTGKHDPIYSPIYDTARGLFWNMQERQVQDIINDTNRIDKYIKKYCENSTPKIGWEGSNGLNHFDLVELLIKDDYKITCEFLNGICTEEKIGRIFAVIKKEYTGLLSPERITLIIKCLEYRVNRILKILQ